MRKKRFATIGTKQMPAALCPYCGETLDAVTGVGFDTAVAPKIQAGNYSVCCYCLEVLCYDGRFYRRVTAQKASGSFMRKANCCAIFATRTCAMRW